MPSFISEQARLKSAISNPSAEDLVHHVFRPLDMVSFISAKHSAFLESKVTSWRFHFNGIFTSGRIVVYLVYLTRIIQGVLSMSLNDPAASKFLKKAKKMKQC